MKIMIATPCAQNQVHRKYLNSLLVETFNHPERLMNQEQYDLGLFHTAGYSGLGKDRGVIASHALRNNLDKIFFIDSDQSWTWQQFKAIADSPYPITAGVVGLKSYPIHLNFTPYEKDMDCFKGTQGISTAGLIKLKKKYESGSEIKTGCEIGVQCMGTAFMCIDVKVLRELSKNGSCPSFQYIDTERGNQVIECFDFFQSGVITIPDPKNPSKTIGSYFGEDWAFCAQASRAGFKSYINPNVLVDHHGCHTFTIGKGLINDYLS